MELTFDERRVAGTLIEKGYTTPEQYPLTINALVTGSNQKSCRNPITSLDEEKVFFALDGLRKKGLCTLIQTQAGRTDRFKHRFADALSLEDREIAVLGELLLRGPQTDGEIRQHASRMVKIEGLEELAPVLGSLMGRNPPLLIRVTPEGRKRGVRYAHCFYKPSELEEIKAREASSAEPQEEGPTPSVPPPGQAPLLREDLEALRAEVSALAARVKKIEEALGGPP